jgi:hypothetical protein
MQGNPLPPEADAALRSIFDGEAPVEREEPPSWVNDYELGGDFDELIGHADEIGDDTRDRLADHLFCSKSEAFRAGRYVGEQS